MKLKRLTLPSLGKELENINKETLSHIIGGYGGNGNCFFNCLEYLNKKYECREGWTYKDYASDYVTGQGNKYDQWLGTYKGSFDEGIDSGPEFVNWSTNRLNNEPFAYLSNCFNTDGSKWTLGGSGMASFFGSSTNINDNSTIVGTFLDGTIESGTTHCVIFTGYDSQTHKYSYYDPTTGSTDTVDYGKVICGAKVNGCK